MEEKNLMQLSVQEYIKSGEYFVDARKWYNSKYIYPLTQRSCLLIVCSIFCVVLLLLVYTIYSLFPIIRQVRYSIKSDNIFQTTANILRANQTQNDPLKSIADIMVRNYVVQRESYNYDTLKQQFTFMQNNSTRVIFRKFFNFMNVDNSLSPVMRYQKSFRRSINILSATYPTEDQCILTFTSTAKSNSGEIIENIVWQVSLDFEIDRINLNLPMDSRFNFAVTNYKLKMIENKLENKNN